MDSFSALMDTIQRETPGQNAEVDTILGEIERSITAVQSAINGVSAQAAMPPPAAGPVLPIPAPSAPAPSAPAPSALSPNEVINIKSNTNVDTPITLGALRTKLNSKVLQPTFRQGDNKFKQAVIFLRQPGLTPQAITTELTRLGIVIKNDNLQGGKKKRRTKKQKGGFIYNAHTKRRSSSSSRKSVTRRRRRSSRSTTHRRPNL